MSRCSIWQIVVVWKSLQNPLQNVSERPKYTFCLRVFTHGIFCFHVSFFSFNTLIINVFKRWNIVYLCFIFSFNVSFKKHWGRKTKTLWERFKNTVGAIQKHCGSVKPLPQCFEKWNMKLKVKHSSYMFHFSKWLIFNYL